MIASLHAPTRRLDHVVAAVADVYAARTDLVVTGNLATVADLPADHTCASVPSVAGDSVLELVLDGAMAVSELSPTVRRLVGEGWDVVVLVPSADIGQAHRSLRGSGSVIQQWWMETDEVAFGPVEIP